MQTALPLLEGSFQRNKVIGAGISLVSSHSSTSRSSGFLLLGPPSTEATQEDQIGHSLGVHTLALPHACMTSNE